MRGIFLFLIFPFFLFSYDLSQKILDHMTLDEKIGQLFMIPACPKRNDNHLSDLENIIEKFHIGGVIVKQSDPETQIDFVNHLQRASDIPLLVGADAEWGLGMRMEDTISFPKNMTLGAVQNNQLLYEMGKEIARELKAIGVHINFAPVVDININVDNPIIGIRAFSDDKNKVTKKAYFIMKGMQDQNIIACLKHFPGIGDIDLDPHLDIPVAYHDKKRLHDIELYPYDFLIKEGALAIMSAHLLLPKISDLPATMSKEILDILVTQKGFKNLLITDALNMKALTKYYTTEAIALYSHIAGNDILLYGAIGKISVDEILLDFLPKAFNAIKQAYLQKHLDIKKLDYHVLKILQAKDNLNLFKSRFIPNYDENMILDPFAYKLKKKLFKEALTIVKNRNLMPIDLNNNILYLTSKTDVSQDLISPKLILENIKCQSIFDKNLDLSSKNIIILSVYESNLTDAFIEKIKFLDPTRTIVIFFGSPYFLSDFKNFEHLILAYQEDKDAYEAAIEFIFGNIKANGTLPIELPFLTR